MKEEFQRKNIIFYSIFTVLTMIVLNLCIKPENISIKNCINKFTENLPAHQNIAPQRLYVNVWRITKNSYFDETLNNQNWTRWRYRYLKYIKNEEDAEVAINTMLLSLNDPYTKFLQSDMYNKQKMIMNSKIYGLGIMFVEIGKEIFVRAILDNSPAKDANIMPGDTVLSINGINTQNIDSDKLSEIIKESRDEKISITLSRNGIETTKQLEKKDIYLPAMEYEITKDNIGIIIISNIMGEKTVNDFKKILNETNNTKGIIIDLRNNYGGILANAIQMANYMLNEDEILSIDSRVNSEYKIYSANERIFEPKPVIILINKNTASAAEILAGTLKDNINALLIGEKSYGKNSIQHVIPISNTSGLIITTDKFIFPSGKDIHKKGLFPDIEIKQTNTESKKKNDIQMEQALKLLRKAVKNK